MIYKFNVPEDINKKLLTWITDKSELSTEALAGNIQEEYSLTKGSAPELIRFITKSIEGL